MEPKPSPTAPDLRSIEPIIRRELRRHSLSERERLVADAIIEITLGFGIPSVRIPKLEVLSDITGLDRSHIHSVLKSLHEMRIIITNHKEAGILLTPKLDSETWKVKPRIPRATILRGLEVIREYNRIPTPSGDSLNFKEYDPAQFLLPGVADFSTTL